MMKSPNLTLNILTFTHPHDEYTFYFANEESEGTCRIYRNLVPEEVIKHFGEQQYYYTSFDTPYSDYFPVTKKSSIDFSSPSVETAKSEGENSSPSKGEVSVGRRGSRTTFSISILKRYLNSIIHNYFTNLGLLVKPNFIHDTEVWILNTKLSSDTYTFYEKFTIKVQFRTVTTKPELLITYDGKSKVFIKSISDFMSLVSPLCFNWVIYSNTLQKHDKLREDARRDLENAYPVWNFAMRDALQQPSEAPPRDNKYDKFKTGITWFIKKFLLKPDFRTLIPLESGSLAIVNSSKLSSVKSTSNKLAFGNMKFGMIPKFDFRDFGPYEISPNNKIHFFFIVHENDSDAAKKIDRYFKGLERGFTGLYKYASVPYFTKEGFSIKFSNKENPLPEIKQALTEREFNPDVQYIAIYLSPISKNVYDKDQHSIYYKVKEYLLKMGITSQALDAQKVANQKNYHFNLANIAVAILAKLDGVPWRLDTKQKNELIVGVGAFTHTDTEVQYIGSAFSFANNGKFNRFECFRKTQTEELAGSIIRSINDYVAVNNTISRLIIHFYKEMSRKEVEPIEKALHNLGFDIPVFIVTINKTESSDIVAFDNNWEALMPLSGTFINVGRDRYLLFNNTRYNDKPIGKVDGYPFPIKLKITCSEPELAKDTRIKRELIDQVYQFSRMYWKSVRQQNLPVTIKYPEMVAEIFPHFDGNEIPEFGKNNLWFL